MKYCIKCGKEIHEGNDFCTNCGTMINTPLVKSKKNDGPSGISIVVAVIYFILSVIILVISMSAASTITDGAKELIVLRSVGGNSVAEAYYNECGIIYSGLAVFVRAFGIFAGSVTAYLGYKSLKNN